MENREAIGNLEKARLLLLEVSVMALQKDMKPFEENLDEIRSTLREWEKLLANEK